MMHAAVPDDKKNYVPNIFVFKFWHSLFISANAPDEDFMARECSRFAFIILSAVEVITEN